MNQSLNKQTNKIIGFVNQKIYQQPTTLKFFKKKREEKRKTLGFGSMTHFCSGF